LDVDVAPCGCGDVCTDSAGWEDPAAEVLLPPLDEELPHPTAASSAISIAAEADIGCCFSLTALPRFLGSRAISRVVAVCDPLSPKDYTLPQRVL
jgi:hypothetical protein